MTPRELKQTLGRLNNLFEGNEQFDACEFTQLLLEMLDNERKEEKEPISNIF